MQTINQLKIGDIIYDIAAKYDVNDNNIQDTYTTKQYVADKIAELVDSAPETLDTLSELAKALGEDKDFSTTVATQLGLKVDKEDGKGLSTEDFTTALKEVLEGLPDKVEAKYTKPSTGIPKTDLASDIQASLGKADSAVQDISGKLDKTTYDTDKVTFALKSEIPTTLPASDVSAWAKATTKPTYTAAEVGLGNVDNTSDKDKPISNATQNALDKKADKTNLDILATDVASLTKSVDNIQGLEELLSYGIQFDSTVADPTCTRIGNPLLHKSLPIQSAYKGCIVKDGELQYYLDPNDWSKKADGTDSILDGTDGDVCVETPEFYLKCTTVGTVTTIRESLSQIDENYKKIPSMFVDAYRGTVNSNKFRSVVNTATDFRGGSNASNRDTYLETDVFRTDLGKPRTSTSRATFRTWARNAGKELLSYDQYKAVFYWNYVIEYANFNSQAAYKADLTSDGYRQGGLGNGITNMGNWSEYNGYNPLTPCGYGNDLGNFTGVKDLVIPAFDYTKNSIWFNSMAVNNSTCASSNSTNNSKLVTAVKSIDNYAFYHNPDNIWGTYTYVISGLTDDQSITFKEGSSYATAETKLTVTEDGTYTVDWAAYNTGGQKWVSFGKVQDSCNIKIYNSSVNSTTITRASQTLKMPRWRGFDNPFGDIWANLDGIVLKIPNMYIICNKDNYTDSLTDIKYDRLISDLPTQEGWIKSQQLGEYADFAPKTVGGGSTTYMCDYYWQNSNLNTLLVGGHANDGAAAGLAGFGGYGSVGGADASIGARGVLQRD